MATVALTVSTAGVVEQVMERIRRGNPAVMEQIATMMADEAERSIAAGVSPWGEAHPPLSPTTLRLREKGFGLPSGALAKSMRTTASGDEAMALVTGEASLYAGVRQFGNPANRLPNTDHGAPAPIPARPFLPIRGGGVDVPQATIDRYLELLRRAFVEGA